MNFPLVRFINSFGTGVKVVRNTITHPTNPDEFVAGGIKTQEVILEDIRFIEAKTDNNTQSEYSQQTKPTYHCHFFDTDGVKPGDIVFFNLENEKKKVAFTDTDENLTVVQVNLDSSIGTGFPNHNTFQGQLNY